MGVFATIMTGLAAQAQDTVVVMIDVEAGRRHRSERPAEGMRRPIGPHRASRLKGGIRRDRGCNAAA
jgi:hypothetical protein